MAQKIVVLKPTLNVRRGTNSTAGIVGRLTVGQQLPVLGLQTILGKGKEAWLEVDWPDASPAYVCVRLSDGTEMCAIVETNPPTDGPRDYSRGFMDGRQSVLRDMIQWAQEELKK